MKIIFFSSYLILIRDLNFNSKLCVLAYVLVYRREGELNKAKQFFVKHGLEQPAEFNNPYHTRFNMQGSTSCT